MTDKKFTVETRVTFEAKEANEAAGLHFFHDPLMNFWLASTVRDGKKRVEVGKYNLGHRTDLWSVDNGIEGPVYLKVAVDGEERATFFFSGDGKEWKKVGESIYFGASGHHLRNGLRGDPDLGWVGRYKDKTATPAEIKGEPNPGLPNRAGNIWTAATFGVFAVRGGATESRPADFDYFRVNVGPKARP